MLERNSKWSDLSGKLAAPSGQAPAKQGEAVQRTMHPVMNRCSHRWVTAPSEKET
jgi:hypothetical protein